MALFARTLVTDPQFVPLRLTTRRSLHIKAWGVRVRGDILHALIDKGSHPLLVGLRLPTVGRASVERLIAPSVRSTSGVTLGGQRLNAQAGWQGKPTAEILAPSTAGYRLTLPRYSAALLSVRVRAGALGANHPLACRLGTGAATRSWPRSGVV